MRSWRSRIALVCAVLLGVTSGSVSAAKALPCADYVSTGLNDAPGVGHLVGTSTVTYEIQVKPGGVGATITETFEIGVYEFDNNVRLTIDCRTYTLYRM